MKKRNFISALLVASMLTAVPVYAEEQVSSYDMEEIIVTADRDSVDSSEVNVKIVNPGSVKSVPDLLRQVTGININARSSYDSIGNEDHTVKMRGFNARRFTVLIDGRPINMSGVMGGTHVNWNNIPIDNIDRIKIIKGAKAAAHGNVVGGVINIITKDYKEPSGEINVGTGENGGYQYRLNYGATQDDITWNFYVNKFGSDAFLRNNDYDAEQYGLAVKYKFNNDNDSIKFSVDKTEERRGRIIANHPGVSYPYDPSYPTVPTGEGYNPGSYVDRDMYTYSTAWRHNMPNGFFDLSFWKNDEKLRDVRYTSGAVTYDAVTPSDQSRGWLFTGQYAPGKHTYGYGIDYRNMRYGKGWYNIGSGSAIYPSQKVDLLGIYVEDTWKLNDRWTGNIGLRYDKMDGGGDTPPYGSMKVLDYNESGISPKVNFSFRNNDSTITFLSVSRIWRAPSMPEFYWWSRQGFPSGNIPGGNTVGLKPEKGWGYEIGVEKKASEAFTTKLTAYYQDIDDYINFVHTAPFYCYNIPDVKIWGMEWENTYKLNANSKIYLNYTNLHTRKDGTLGGDWSGKPGSLDYNPRHNIALGYTYNSNPWLLNYSVNYRSSRTAYIPAAGAYNANNEIYLGGYVVHNLSLTRNLDKNSSITVSVDNLLDKDYAEIHGYPMQGRIFSANYQLKI